MYIIIVYMLSAHYLAQFVKRDLGCTSTCGFHGLTSSHCSEVVIGTRQGHVLRCCIEFMISEMSRDFSRFCDHMREHNTRGIQGWDPSGIS